MTRRKNEDEAFRRLSRAFCQIDGLYHEIAARQGLSDSAAELLFALTEAGGARMLRDVVAEFGTCKQTLNSTLRKFERDGVIVLEPVDGKSKRVRLAPKGVALAKRTVLKVVEIERKINASWTEEERNLYIELTERYLRQLREETKNL